MKTEEYEGIIISSKKDHIESFKEMYSRSPSKEELKAFIECLQAKKEKED
jgi:hypothetical protein